MEGGSPSALCRQQIKRFFWPQGVAAPEQQISLAALPQGQKVVGWGGRPSLRGISRRTWALCHGGGWGRGEGTSGQSERYRGGGGLGGLREEGGEAVETAPEGVRAKEGDE